MKQPIVALALILIAHPVIAYGYNGTDIQQRDTYVGIRIHKNENIAFEYKPSVGDETTVRRDSFGIGGTFGNRLSDHITVEFETSYTGASQSNFDYDIWSNMFNTYLFQEYSGAISPYIGLGIGFASIWGDITTNEYQISDSAFDLSFQTMLGVNFALNERIDFNLGIKYQYYGVLEHNKYGKTTADATEFYFGASYKFGLK